MRGWPPVCWPEDGNAVGFAGGLRHLAEVILGNAHHVAVALAEAEANRLGEAAVGQERRLVALEMSRTGFSVFGARSSER